MEALMGYFLGFLQLKKIHYIYASIIDVSSWQLGIARNALLGGGGSLT